MNKKMKKIINYFKIINSRTLFALGVLASALFVLPVIVAATTYSPGAILNPDCSPEDADCGVTIPAVSGANTDITSLGGTLYVNSSTNKIGIGISNPGADLDIKGNGSLYLDASAGVADELLAGVSIGGYSDTNMYLVPSLTSTVRNKLQLGYYNGNEWLTALEYAHSEGGVSTYSDLYLLKAGGSVGINTGSNAPRALLHVGDRDQNNSIDATILVSRTIDSGTGNAHGFSDSSNFARTGDVAYFSFDSKINVTGITNFNHIISFQDAPALNFTGTLDKLYGGVSVPSLAHGTTTNRYGWYSGDVDVTGGTVANNYGVYVKDLNNGNNNYAVYTAGDTQSYFGGKVGIGTSTPDKLFTVWGDSRLNGSLFDVNNSTGTVGQALTATAGGIDWKNEEDFAGQSAYDATVCSSGCDYSSIALALDGEGDNKSIRVFRGTYIENSNVTAHAGQNIYFDDVIMQVATHTLYINEAEVNLEGVLEIQGDGTKIESKTLFEVETSGDKLNTSNLKLTITPTDGLDHDMEMELFRLLGDDCIIGDIIMQDFTMNDSAGTGKTWRLVAVIGSNNVFQSINIHDLVFSCPMAVAGRMILVTGAENVFDSVKIKNLVGSNTGSIFYNAGFAVYADADYTSATVSVQDVTNTVGDGGYGVLVAGGSNYSSIRGISLDNDSTNLSNSGTGNNVTGLIYE